MNSYQILFWTVSQSVLGDILLLSIIKNQKICIKKVFVGNTVVYWWFSTLFSS